MVELKDKIESGIQKTQAEASSRSLAGGVATLASAALLSVLMMGLTWGVVECIFAAAHVGEDTVAQPDPLLGYSHLENQMITFRSEGYSRSLINPMGFRDRIYAVPKPPGVKRVCITGDSMTMGLEVPLSATYPKLLEKRFQAEGKNIEVVNCGMSGTGTGQQFLGWRQSISRLQPDMLIIGYHLGDTDDNVGGGTNPPRPTFLVDAKNNHLNVDFADVDRFFAGENSRFYSSFGWFRRNSRVLAVLNKMDLDLHADPAHKLVMNVIGKPIGAAWSSLLKKLPAGNWQIQERRAIVADLLPGSNSVPKVNAPASPPPPSPTPASDVTAAAVSVKSGDAATSTSDPATEASATAGSAKPASATAASAKPASAKPASAKPASATPASATPVSGSLSASGASSEAVPATAASVAIPTAVSTVPSTEAKAMPVEHGQADIDLYRGMIWLHNQRMQVTLSILKELNAECKAHNCKLVVAGLPAYNNTIIYYRELQDIRKLAEKEHFGFVECWTPYPRRGPLEDSKYHFSTHFNCAGHQVMAETLYKRVFQDPSMSL